MPLIEELPVTSTAKASHGWAYVPDTGPIAAQQPGTRHNRKRAAATVPRGAALTTAKREKAIQQRLETLNKENYKDGVSIPITPRPGREKSVKKVTSNVRRILAYQRNFKHYLDEEEALHPGATHYTLPPITTGMGPPATPATPAPAPAPKDTSKRKSGRASTTESSSKASPAPTTTTTPKPRSTKRSRQAAASASEQEAAAAAEPETPKQEGEGIEVKAEDAMDIETPEDTSMPDAPPSLSAPAPVQPDYPPEWDNDPLLRSLPSEVPPMPSDRIMQILISEPPLTFNAARATPLDEDQRLPPLRFCGMCGYFGKVRCKKCEDWTCGLMECWKSHEATCPMANVYG